MMKYYLNAFDTAQQRFRMSGEISPFAGPTIIQEVKIRSIMSQVLQALSFMNARGYFHRDIKPENILVKNEVVKIADLGLAREISSRPPYTDYVSTRWYRAPEVLLRSSFYNSPIDIFAVGCILAEMYTLHPLFPGSSEIDQIHRIFHVIGGPTEDTWPEGVNLVNSMGIALTSDISQQQQISNNINKRLQNVLPQMRHRPEALDLLKEMICLNPKSRVSAKKSLEHPFFKVDLDRFSTLGIDDQYARFPVISQHLPPMNMSARHQQALHVRDENAIATLAINPMQQWIDESKKYFTGLRSQSSSASQLYAPASQSYTDGIFLSKPPYETSLTCGLRQRSYPFSDESFPGGALSSSNIRSSTGPRCSDKSARGLGSNY